MAAYLVSVSNLGLKQSSDQTSFKVVEVDCTQKCITHIYESNAGIHWNASAMYPRVFVLDTRQRIFCVMFCDFMYMWTIVSVCLDWLNETVVTFRTENVGRHSFLVHLVRSNQI